jgi:hypothetical protein
MRRPSSKASPESTAIKFNEYINARDLDGLSILMTDDHKLVTDSSVQGKEKVLEAWKEFFRLFPDYKNIFDSMEARDNLVKVEGRSTCSDKRLDGSALWMVRMEGGKVAEWHVFDDTPENRGLIGIKWRAKGC